MYLFFFRTRRTKSPSRLRASRPRCQPFFEAVSPGNGRRCAIVDARSTGRLYHEGAVCAVGTSLLSGIKSLRYNA